MDYIGLLKRMIETPSLSRQEDGTATLIYDTLRAEGVDVRRWRNNVWALSDNFNPALPTLMLNSHHDTVKPAAAYTRDPYSAVEEQGLIYGLGSNDAGASVVSLAETFLRRRSQKSPYNLLLALTAEEEVTGENGMRAFIPYLADEGIKIDMALVGEPTLMQPAVAERGLVVLDCVTRGVAGHAARNEGVNALYKAMADIERIRAYRFPDVSDELGPVSLQVTQIQSGSQHNVVPDMCKWVVDVRTTDAYSNEQTVELLRQVAVDSELMPRSTRVRASVISRSHPLVVAALRQGKQPFVSPTTSDMSQMAAFPSLKMGPGFSGRSHTADEYIEIEAIHSAVNQYNSFLNNLSNLYNS